MKSNPGPLLELISLPSLEWNFQSKWSQLVNNLAQFQSVQLAFLWLPRFALFACEFECSTETDVLIVSFWEEYTSRTTSLPCCHNSAAVSWGTGKLHSKKLNMRPVLSCHVNLRVRLKHYVSKRFLGLNRTVSLKMKKLANSISWSTKNKFSRSHCAEFKNWWGTIF